MYEINERLVKLRIKNIEQSLDEINSCLKYNKPKDILLWCCACITAIIAIQKSIIEDTMGDV